MSRPSIHADTIVRTVMDAYPATIAVFIRRRMQCPGCILAPFVDLAEAARSYAVDTDELIRDLRVTAASAASGGRP